ncbi:MoeB/ThiF family adenylyltransferase [Pontibacillus sp. HMF3514]|uniref:MoeB/ThiF family adenylyltransferase n=1 Tax=Pontibacillus sp. HMF3514 TaxID=2692425 RepID=UPI00131FD659|nr:MoeB/ThiF family adenylyltransferase [Pontibacillus sp. HMF3514]QHE53511.1 thiamine biosynthesis protein MoeB [Pontibacillus sp. HMF3514]
MGDRFSRQKLFAPIGEKGQIKLSQKHVFILGAGALGTANAEQLVRAGVGQITIADRDYVDWSNLQRQQLYGEEDASNAVPKAIAAKNRLNAINSGTTINKVVGDMGVDELHEIIPEVDLIIDATDNFETRMKVNDIAQYYKKTWIYGACVGSYGLSFTIVPEKTPCLHCLLDILPSEGATCDTAGIISPVVQMVVAHQVTEAMKILVEDYEALRSKIVSFDLWKNEFSSVDVSSLKKGTCPSCGVNQHYPYLKGDSQTKTTVLCGRDTVQIRPMEPMKRDLEVLNHVLLRTSGEVKKTPYVLMYQQGPYRLVFFQDGRVLVHGTKDVAKAKSLYNQCVG